MSTLRLTYSFKVTGLLRPAEPGLKAVSLLRSSMAYSLYPANVTLHWYSINVIFLEKQNIALLMKKNG